MNFLKFSTKKASFTKPFCRPCVVDLRCVAGFWYFAMLAWPTRQGFVKEPVRHAAQEFGHDGHLPRNHPAAADFADGGTCDENKRFQGVCVDKALR